ncbi:MAG: sulfatase-like hydrolase/transferase [Clostridia bacterium]|nr:sulfatase-like hydrolase/transferase [Clostridia bacterium]
MFATNADKNEKNYRKGRIAFAIFASLFGGFTVGMCSLFFASGPYTYNVWLSYLTNPYILLLNIIPPIILSAVFYLLFNRTLWSFIATNALVIIPSLVNYYKIAFRGDCFIAADFSLISESSKMLESYKLFIDRRIGIYLAVLAIGCVMLALFAKGRFRKGSWYRYVAAVIILALSAALIPIYTSDEVYNKKTSNTAVESTWTESRLFMSKGFVYPFLYSIKDTFDTPPEGYSAGEAKEILASYKDEAIPDDKKVNIVCVMLEAYNDFSRFDELTFTEDVYAKYRELESIGYSGTLVTDIFAGDTRISERQFLTGMPFDRMDDFVSSSNSYVWYLRENGYTVEGSHPCYAWFYNRQNINKNLGFENYYFTENYYKALSNSDVTWDGKLFPLMRDIYLNRDKSKPYFSFSITYQGHGPYDSDVAHFESPYVESSHVSEADKNILNNYIDAQKGTTEYLYAFVQEMLATEEPLVLVFFGDHKPWMGNAGTVYGSYGINIDTSGEAGFMNYYSTRYLILANDAAKKVTGNSFIGEGDTISVSFLMNKVFELCGYKGNAYMQFTSDIMKEEPIIHRTQISKNETTALYDRVSYYYRKNFVY